MRTALVMALVVGAAGCGSSSDEPTGTASEDLSLPAPLRDADFTAPITKAKIRALQTWIDDATFEAKWASMLTAPIELFGGADSAYHADLGALPERRVPGAETLCHGDPKLDNFGWTLVEGHGVFSDNDFDDAGYCPVAADALRYLVATDLWFGDAHLDAAALDAYVATVADPKKAVVIDPDTAPNWDEVRTKGLGKATKGDALDLGGEVQAATPEEVSAVRALAACDPRFAARILDVARDVRTDGGSAGMRRFWLLTEETGGSAERRADSRPRTILELKEIAEPGTELGRHERVLEGHDRLDVLKELWWGADAPGDHFEVALLGARFLVRDRLIRDTPKADKMTPAALTNLVQAQASLLAVRHRAAWKKADRERLTGWLQVSAATLTARWRRAYAQASGKSAE